MSRDTDIQIVLAARLDNHTVKIILNRGELLGCRYVDKDHCLADTPLSFITPLQAADYIIAGINERERVGVEKSHIIPSIVLQYQDTFCNLIFGNRYNSVSILCDIFNGVYWFKGDPADERIDWARYIRLVLDLCQDFPIFELKTEDSYFESSG